MTPSSSRWRFAITPARLLGFLIELVGAALPFAGAYLIFLGKPHVGLSVGALGMMATVGLIVLRERADGPVSAILRDAKTFRDTPELARIQRAYDEQARTPHAS